MVKSWSVTWKWSHRDYFKGQSFGAEEEWSLPIEAFQIFIDTKGESFVYDFIAFAISQGNRGKKNPLVLSLKMRVHFTQDLQSGFSTAWCQKWVLLQMLFLFLILWFLTIFSRASLGCLASVTWSNVAFGFRPPSGISLQNHPGYFPSSTTRKISSLELFWDLLSVYTK